MVFCRWQLSKSLLRENSRLEIGGAAPGSNRARRRFQYHLCHERLRCCLRRHLHNDLFVNLYAATTLADGNMTYLPDYFKTPQKISFETLEGIQDLKWSSHATFFGTAGISALYIVRISDSVPAYLRQSCKPAGFAYHRIFTDLIPNRSSISEAR